MSAIKIVGETMNGGSSFPKELLELLHNKYPSLPPVEEMISEPEISIFFQEPNVIKSKNNILSIEERRGLYDDKKCDARVWSEKKRSGGLGYDNIQCNKKKADGCFCRLHSRMYSDGTLWTGKITDPRPEEPQMANGKRMFWATDKNGNDIIKKGKKESSKKDITCNTVNKNIKELSIEELLLLIKKKEEDEATTMKKEIKEEIEEEGCEEGEEGGLGAGVGFEGDIIDHKDLKKTTSSCSETTEPCDGLNESSEEGGGLNESSEEEDELYILKTINDVEYQINIDDNTVIRLHDFKIIGEWKSDTKEIQFNEK